MSITMIEKRGNEMGIHHRSNLYPHSGKQRIIGLRHIVQASTVVIDGLFDVQWFSMPYCYFAFNSFPSRY